MISVVPEASQITKFLIGAEGDPNSITFQARFGKVELVCYYEKGEVQVEIGVEFHTQRGPANRSLSSDFEYFVAMSGPEQEIFDKRRFLSGIEFAKWDKKLTVEEPLQQIIPLQPGESGADFRIFIGFQLTPEELQYNRSLSY